MSAQASLFGPAAPGAVTVPDVLDRALGREGAALYVSISGGKDSQAMLEALAALRAARGWACGICAIHADLGRVEWPQSLDHCRAQCEELGVVLKVVTRPQGDLLQEIQDRREKLAGTGRPFWPDAANRYCTADQKRGQIDKVVRGHRLVVNAMGMRGEESPARAKRDALSVNRRLTGKALRDLRIDAALEAWEGDASPPRLAFDWLPLHDWTVGQVWGACGTSVDDLERRRTLYLLGAEAEALDGWPAHPAYVFGNDRVSCSLCILASQNDLRVGALHNPELYRTYVQMERESGYTFQHGKALADVAPELLRGLVVR